MAYNFYKRQFMLRVSTKMWNFLEKQAWREHTNVSQVIRKAIDLYQQHLIEEKKKKQSLN